ncbi:MAG TPA: glycerate kinase [Acidimicrobiales bacterium]|nr:glycerate kinase [Acidimicrobiales bacterium]
MPRLVAAPDKFKGSATAADLAAAACAAATAAGWECDRVPVADGGEGTLEVLGGPNRRTEVTGPLGTPVQAEWRLDGDTAVVEMARASGLVLAGGARGNDPLEATTRGTGELVLAAVGAGARRVVVAVGGSATTDGGLGAVDVLAGRLAGVEVVVACDVETRFCDAAPDFAPQKGATPAQVELLRRRLERLVGDYRRRFGVDVGELAGAGAAGGLAGGLAAIGARLVPGFDLVAEAVGLEERLDGADLAVTGEGFVDEESFHGKVVGGMARLCAEAGVRLVVVAGEVYDAPADLETVSLTARFGSERSHADPLGCVREVVLGVLTAAGGAGAPPGGGAGA